MTPLHRWLKRTRVSARLLGAVMGRHRKVVERWETGEMVPRLKARQEIARITRGAVGVWDWPERAT